MSLSSLTIDTSVSPLIDDEDPRRASLTSKRWEFTLWDSSETKSTKVLEFLSQQLPNLKPLSWPQRLAHGGIYYNGRRLKQDRLLEFPARIEYYEPRFQIEEAESYFPKIGMEHIVYRQDGILAVFKPAGLPSLPAKDQIQYNVRQQLLSLLGTSTSLHMPSRLDASVSGLLILSEDSKLHNKIQLLFERKQISKRYLALVSSVPSWDETEITLPIGRDPSWGVLRRIDPENGKPSHTMVRKLIESETKSCGARALLEVFPLTGRTHQIRLHLASIGFPIVGDAFYGGIKASQLHLLSHSVSFLHPRNHASIKIELPRELTPSWVPINEPK